MREKATPLLAGFFSFFFVFSAGGEGAPSLPWRAGLASAVITPQEPMWMAGYAARNRPSEGKVHDLYLKVLVLQDSRANRLAIVAADLIGFSSQFRNDVGKEISRRYGIPPQALLLNASHTHCGPEIRTGKDALGVMTEERAQQTRAYLEDLKKKCIAAVGRALRELGPARLSYSHARAGFAMNRRLKTQRGFVIGPNPDGPVDHDVPVLRVESPEGKVRAVLFAYACHNTTLDFYKFCGDYAGFAQQYLQEAHPGVVAMFLTGCGADQNPYPRRTLQLAQQHGRALANAVEAALLAPPKEVRGPLGAAVAEIPLRFASSPTREELLAQVSSKNVYRRKRAKVLLAELDRTGSLPETYPYLIQVVQFGGDLTVVALAGEVVVPYSLVLKEKLKGPRCIVLGYCNDVFGYVPTAKILKEGGYEPVGSVIYYSSLTAPFDPSIEEQIITEVCKLARKVRSEAKEPAGTPRETQRR